MKLKFMPPAVVGLATALAALGTSASSSEHAARTALLPLYQQECSSCHIAYAPNLLPAASWQRLMSGLERHFGTNASLDATVAAQLNAWLTAHAAGRRRASEVPPEDRITRSSWFLHEHDEVPAALWRHSTVGSASNCQACHQGAAQGRFDEASIRLPR